MSNDNDKPEIIELPITINALRIGGKKITPAIFKQFSDRCAARYCVSGYSIDLERLEIVMDSLVARHNFELPAKSGGSSGRTDRVSVLWGLSGEIFKWNLDLKNNHFLAVISSKQSQLGDLENDLVAFNRFLDCKVLSRSSWAKVAVNFASNYISGFCNRVELDRSESAAKKEELVALVDEVSGVIGTRELDIFVGGVDEKPTTFEEYFEGHADLLAKINQLLFSVLSSSIGRIESQATSLREELNTIESQYKSLLKKISDIPFVFIGA